MVTTWSPAAADQGGQTADGMIWRLTEDGVLTVYGTGKMPDYRSGDETPWAPWRNSIRTLYLRGSFTTVGAYAFAGCGQLQEVYLVSTIGEVREGAFLNGKKIERFETIPTEPVPAAPAEQIPKTGDRSRPALWLMLVLGGAAGVWAVLRLRRKEPGREKE